MEKKFEKGGLKMTKKKAKIKLCPECYYDYQAGGIQFDKPANVIKVGSVEQCDLELEKKKKIKKVV
jgi:hypothetical protein